MIFRASRFVAPVFSPVRPIRFDLEWGLQILLALTILVAAAFGVQQAAGQTRRATRPRPAGAEVYTLPEVVVTAERRRGIPVRPEGD
ncbi:hypothetical protein [Gloeobacter morelensis]|uniref:Uncharacterized protein n=1 Tax=Gloeobacter morelensis MG652769 TaxID=2781736 RepID=A0ABY3PGY7_9CYAN|nr:hypothetical protein [Gloeobacter morelensis]UFP92817.1 hypothetical protein ISF26_13375 [Gloeobacter morelensis MG652769]